MARSLNLVRKRYFRNKVDRDLKFDEHFNNLCKKVCQNLNALVRLAPFMNVDKKVCQNLNALVRLAPFMNVDKKKNDNESFYGIAIWILS